MEERAEWTRSSQPASTSGSSVRCAALRDDILAGILDGKDVKVTFDDFPYYLRYDVFSIVVFCVIYEGLIPLYEEFPLRPHEVCP